MQKASKPMSVRLDLEALEALSVVAGNTLSRSAAIRQALIEAAERRRRRSALAAEAQNLAEDPDDRDEMQDIAEMMEELRVPR